jgi:acetylornithine deacetylase/succinyl-diaminopimelate desuccinylase-like protein
MPALSLNDFERDALATLTTYATIPCLSPMFDEHWQESGHIERAVGLLADWARARTLANFDVTVHRLEGRTPVLCVTVESTGASSGTVLLYGHLDKQPPLGDWSDGLGPYAPVRRGDRLYARGVVDDGYSTFAALLAIEAMEASGIPHSRCVVLIEASEESGSPDLDAYLDLLTDHLGNVELMICLDSGGLSYDRLWLTTSLRGIVNAEVTVNVLTQGLHSGSVSGVVPSSFRLLRQLLDRVEDPSTGEILIKELHCEIPENHVTAAKEVANEFGDFLVEALPTTEGVSLMGDCAADRMLRSTWCPTLSVIGVGGIPEPEMAGNVLRPFTTVVLSFRLPPLVDAKVASGAIERTLSADAPFAKVTVSQAADGWMCPPLQPWLEEALLEASTDAFGRPPGFCGEGGSIPFLASLGKRFPAVQFVATGALGPKSNAHGIDEMLDLPTAVGVTNSVITVLGSYANKKD